MTLDTPQQLRSKQCAPCEGGAKPYTRQQAAEQLRELPEWNLGDDGNRIAREWTARDFQAAIEFFNRIATLAEAEGHHPDLHLEGYRKVRVELSTHAIGGLSENDFILAAKIDAVPIAVRR